MLTNIFDKHDQALVDNGSKHVSTDKLLSIVDKIHPLERLELFKIESRS